MSEKPEHVQLDWNTFKQEFSKFIISEFSNFLKVADVDKFKTIVTEHLLAEFLMVNGYLPDDPDVDTDDEIKEEAMDKAIPDSVTLKEPKKIKKLSENLNKYDVNRWDLNMLRPGDIVYTIVKISPTVKIPWVRYKPELRVLTAVDGRIGRESGFVTYAHKVTGELGVNYHNAKKSVKVISEEEFITRPYTREEAMMLCKRLNLDAKDTYKKYQQQENKKCKKTTSTGKTKTMPNGSQIARAANSGRESR